MPILILAALLVQTRRQSVTVDDVTVPQVFTIPFADSWAITSGVRVQLVGRLDGEANVSINDGITLDVRGDIDLVQYGDLFVSEALVIRYQPRSVRSGRLTVHYRVYWQTGGLARARGSH
ncbi:MAG: hypothetical protein KF774_12795 [Planctomyces sp.]|nr:hypothetical protein [Planctomyces sp.]